MAREELVWATTSDGFMQDGAVIRPDGVPAKPLAVVWMHGYTGRFSERHTMTIGRYLADCGYTFVTGNNRGQNIGVNLQWTKAGPTLGGGWWEKWSEAPIDVRAWLDFTAGLGFDRLVLAGHSYGALKVVAFMGAHGDPRVVGLISASGPVRASEHLKSAPEDEALAARLVAEGRGSELLLRAEGPLTGSARTLHDRAQHLPDVYGTEGGNAPPLERVKVPLLALLGTEELGIGLPPDLELIRSNAKASPRVDTALIEGADHVYTGVEVPTAKIIEEWLQTIG